MTRDGGVFQGSLCMLCRHWRTFVLMGLVILTAVVAILMSSHASNLIQWGGRVIGATLFCMLCLGAWAGRRG